MDTENMSGTGMDQVTARHQAKKLGGIAVSARNPEKYKKWKLGGWPLPDDVWIVVSRDKTQILDDGSGDGDISHAISTTKDCCEQTLHEAAELIRRHGFGKAADLIESKD